MLSASKFSITWIESIFKRSKILDF